MKDYIRIDEKTLLCFALVVAFILGGSFGFRLRGRLGESEPSSPIVRTDTLWFWRYDTVTVEKPVPRIVRVVDTMFVPVLDPIHTRDSTFIPIPREEKIYQDSTYRAVVSGYRPSLDSISVFRATEVITITETVKVPQNKRWGIGIQAGGTYLPKVGPTPYIGIGISYNLLVF